MAGSFARTHLTHHPRKALADMDTTTTASHHRTIRVEDDRFLRGLGRYMADAPQSGEVYAYFVRSLHACADIKSIDVSAALAVEGVVAVITAEDLKAANVGNLSMHPPVAGRGGAARPGPAVPPAVLGAGVRAGRGNRAAESIAPYRDDAGSGGQGS